MKVSDLNPNPENPRKITEDKLKMLKASLDRFGDLGGIVFNRTTGRLVSGHQRIKTIDPSQEIHIEKKYKKPNEQGTVATGFIRVNGESLSYREVEMDELTEKAAMLSANTNAGEWVSQSRAEILLDLESHNYPIEITGLDKNELEEIMAPWREEKTGLTDDDDIPPVQKETKIRQGDLFRLGNHRLLCGDSTDKAQVEKLMNGEKADMVFTDPPYGVSYADKNVFLNTISFANRSEKHIQNDHQSPEEMADLWLKFLEVAHEVTTDKCSYYICSPQGGELMMMMMVMIPKAGWQLKHMLIWAKNNHVLGRADYNYKHEPILYGWKEKGTHEFYGKGATTTLWEYDKPLKNDLHPTMKPIAIMENALLNSTKLGQLTYDPFLGSGSTLIACEKTNRKCYGMEIDPQYCQVIIDRWEKFTGKKAEKINQKTILKKKK